MKLEDYRRELRQNADYLAAEAEFKPLLDLADEVLALRLERGWFQADLAERVGSKQANISRLESGLSNPTVKFLQKVADALDAELTIRLVPRFASRLHALRTSDQSAAGSSEDYVAVLNWPLPQESRGFVWDDHASASSVQELEVAA